jgi:hypothetical protein
MIRKQILLFLAFNFNAKINSYGIRTIAISYKSNLKSSHLNTTQEISPINDQNTTLDFTKKPEITPKHSHEEASTDNALKKRNLNCAHDSTTKNLDIKSPAPKKTKGFNQIEEVNSGIKKKN